MRILLIAIGTVLLIGLVGCMAFQRKMLYFPTHLEGTGGLDQWIFEGQVIGLSRKVENPENVWLMIHGNGG